MQKNKGFTLIELLVVISVIAILLSILMPSLKKAKKAAKRIHCLNNIKNLTTGWMLYVNDNDNRMPKARASNGGWIQSVDGYPRKPQDAPKELQLEAIRNGTLFSYLKSAKVYRCPVADKNEFRTYSLPHSMNGFNTGGGGKILTKTTQITRTASRIVFLDDYAFDYDSCWQVWYSRPAWWNTTPIRHGSGGNVFSFADGHSDFKNWKDKRTIELAEEYAERNSPEGGDSTQENNEDLQWVQKAVWGELGYEI
mgnify:CR=1 FL=1